MIELRYSDNRAELRAESENSGQSRHVVGYALKFNSLSNDLGGFYETIAPGSLDGVLERSDVLALLDHNRERGVLARSSFGKGSLTLSVDNVGLRYEFDAPMTALGDELVEGLRRGDISASSFGFTIAEDGDMWEKRADGSVLRTITKFDRLFDVSPVYFPAYSATQVDVRGLKTLEENISEQNNNMTEDENLFARMMELRNQMEELQAKINERSSEEDSEKKEEVEENSCDSDKKDEERSEETEKKVEEQEKNSDESEKSEEERADEAEEKEEEKTEESAEENEEKSSEEEEKDNKDENRNLDINIKMKEEKFSLLRSLNDLINGRQMSESTAKVHEAGLAELRKSNISASAGSLVLPLTADVEQRNTLFATVANQGKEAVASDWLNIYAGLREALVFDKLGCTTMTGLVGDIVMPAYTNTVAYWKSEGSKADDGAGTFSTKEMKPHRLTALVNVSRQLLIQDSVGAEEMLRRDIVESLAYAWQKQVFSADAGLINVKPAGIFNGVSADVQPLDYESVVLMEQTLKHDNIPGNYKYLLSTSAEAVTRTTRVDSGSGIMIQNNDSINGIPVVSSGIVEDKAIALGNWGELINGIWSGITLEIDKYSRLDEDIIRIVAVMYVDSIVRRDNAIVKKILA